MTDSMRLGSLYDIFFGAYIGITGASHHEGWHVFFFCFDGSAVYIALFLVVTLQMVIWIDYEYIVEKKCRTKIFGLNHDHPGR